jgi:hypothetical protein
MYILIIVVHCLHEDLVIDNLLCHIFFALASSGYLLDDKNYGVFDK